MNKQGGFYWKREMYQSDAFLLLSKNSMKMLIALLDIRKREPSSLTKSRRKKGRLSEPVYVNIDSLEMPYETLKKKYGMTQQGIASAIDQLLAYGFIKITRHGGLGEHHTSQYALIDDYITWKPGITFRTRERDLRRGYQGKRLGASAKLAHEITPFYTHENHTLPENCQYENHTLKKAAFTPVTIQDNEEKCAKIGNPAFSKEEYDFHA